MAVWCLDPDFTQGPDSFRELGPDCVLSVAGCLGKSLDGLIFGHPSPPHRYAGVYRLVCVLHVYLLLRVGLSVGVLNVFFREDVLGHVRDSVEERLAVASYPPAQ